MFRALTLLLVLLLLRSSFAAPATTRPYGETYRPQFHFTARENWLNDPNGLVYFGGEFHLFFQRNPKGIQSGNLTWGHAVSTDLLHWKQLDDALAPDALGMIFSGSAVVDHDNTAGFQTGKEPALVAIYTAAGGIAPESKDKPFTQCLAFSNDRGRTWTKFSGNPVVPNIAPGNRDPKAVWHAPTKRWIMALYGEKSDFALLASPDLKTWQHLQDLTIPGSDECPDFFEMPLDGDPFKPRWIFTSANGHYLVGTFDGQHFDADAGPFASDHGANYYAVQSYSNAPDARRIQIAWMRDGKYPGMPFNQQMSFPCELTLRTTKDGPRLIRQPVREIQTLYRDPRTLENVQLEPGAANPLSDVVGDCFDLTIELAPSPATTEIALSVRGHPLTYDPATHDLKFLGRAMTIHPAADGHIKLRLLIDRTSLEVFADEGLSVLSSCFLPEQDAPALSIQTKGAPATIIFLELHSLHSIWGG